MSYQLIITQKANYLHVVVTGQNTMENVLAYMTELLHVCATRKCHRVLVEERLDGPRLKLVDVFHLVMEGSLKARGFFKDLAYVDVHAEGDLMKFAQDTASLRGLHFHLFTTVAEAEAWIKHDHPDPVK